ncbi:MAG: helix-turn-helix domain-containing protein [Microthrixaceae bacterium]
MNNHLTLIEAAQFLGVSTQTVRRMIQRKTLMAKQFPGPHGIRWEIERVEILRYLETVKNLGQAPHEPQQIGVEPVGLADAIVVGEQVNIGANSIGVDHGQHLNQLGQNREGVVEFANGAVIGDGGNVVVNSPPVDHGQQVVPLAAHLAALELLGNLQSELAEARRLADQAERAKMALEWQMHKYQVTITDHAESLAEAQAMRKVAEARLEARDCSTAEIPIQNLKVAGAERKGWGSRLRSWLGISKAG